jgi:hypothetical protein
MYNYAGVFLFHDFQKSRRSTDFWVSLYLPIFFTSVPGRGDKSTRLNRGCILQFICSQESQSGSDPFMSLITTRSIR